jgi:hypothetical protein
LEEHKKLQGHYKYKDPRFTAQAKDYESHRYDHFHRRLDADIAREIRANPQWTPKQFENHLNKVYNHPELRGRFPGGLEPDPR